MMITRNSFLFGVAVLVIPIGLIILATSLYTINEGEYVLIMSFGKPIGHPISNPGIRLKLPIVQKVVRLPAHPVEWTSSGMHCVTRDNYTIEVEAFANWQISDPLDFFMRLGDQFAAQIRLDDLLTGETCKHLETIGLQDLVALQKEGGDNWLSTLKTGNGLVPRDEIKSEIQAAILASGQERVNDWGLDIIDFRISTLVYTEGHSSEGGSGGG